jgi:3-methyl-2-oxobutanoate hydroxymethyltransferase
MTKNTVLTMRQQKRDGEKIVMVTSYDYSMARIVEASDINGILVGDSLGMTMLGYPDTLPVTMDDMVHHTAAVTSATNDTLVVADMPFLSFATPHDAVMNAGRLIKEGHANAVKLEGGARVCDQIRAIVANDIPVQAHIGLTPQSTNAFGGFKVQGKTVEVAKRLVQDALDVEAAGAFSVVLECIPGALAAYISEQLDIPTIGIGAGAGCDGQILVYQDMFGLSGDFKPKFVKQFAPVGELFAQGYAEYVKQVRDGSFPAEENTFSISEEVMDEVRKG